MTGSGSTRIARAYRITGVGAVLALMVLAAACSSSKKSSGANTSDSSTVSSSAVLGQASPATGTPVKVGMITDGSSNCNGQCGTADETPAALASIAWANQYSNGLAGHPMQLDLCSDDLDPGKATDCANQMIRDNVAAVVIGSDGVIEDAWKVLHDAHIPVINSSATSSALVADSTSTYVLNDPNANVVGFPIAVAKQMGVKKVSIIIVDLPIATDIFKGDTPNVFKKAGITLQLVPVPLGTPDMTPQAQRIVASNPDGVVLIVGFDQFCIPAYNGLRAVGFHGTYATITQCMSDATRKAVSSDVLKGMRMVSLAPYGDTKDTSMQQWKAVIDKFANGKLDPSASVPLLIFQDFGALSVGTKDLKGDVTPASVNNALHTMANQILPGSGNRWFRCNGKASTSGPSICSTSVVSQTLDGSGNPTKSDIVNNNQIPG